MNPKNVKVKKENRGVIKVTHIIAGISAVCKDSGNRERDRTEAIKRLRFAMEY